MKKTKERDSKPKTVKAGSLPRKQNKNISRNNKKLLKKISASGFKNITEQANSSHKYNNNYI